MKTTHTQERESTHPLCQIFQNPLGRQHRVGKKARAKGIKLFLTSSIWSRGGWHFSSECCQSLPSFRFFKNNEHSARRQPHAAAASRVKGGERERVMDRETQSWKNREVEMERGRPSHDGMPGGKLIFIKIDKIFQLFQFFEMWPFSGQTIRQISILQVLGERRMTEEGIDGKRDGKKDRCLLFCPHPNGHGSSNIKWRELTKV